MGIVLDTAQDIDRKPALRTLYHDIEVYSPNEFPDPSLSKHPIVCSSYIDNFVNKYTTITWHPSYEEDVTYTKYKEMFTNKKRDHIIYKFKNEYDAEKFTIEFIGMCDPDIITGWYSNKFDLPYRIHRLPRIGLKSALLSDIKTVYSTDRNVFIYGKDCFDLIDGYKKIHVSGLESNELDHVSSKELNTPKLHIPVPPNVLWMENPEKLIDYNVGDVELCYYLDKELDIVGFFDSIRRFSCVPFEKVLFNSLVLESFIMSSKPSYIGLPTRKYEFQRGRFEGALVIEPTPGIFDNVLVLDLAKLYPNCIITCNMSPETIVVNPDPKDKSLVVLGNGYGFKKEPIGFCSQLLLVLFKERKKIEDQRKKYDVGTKMYNLLTNKRQVIKDLINSFYGSLSFERFRLYVEGLGESVTFLGRNVMLWTKSKIEDYGLQYLYGDTDSIFLRITPDVVKDKYGKTHIDIDILKEIGYDIARRVTESYDELVKQFNITNHSLLLDFEKIYKRVLFTEAKKKYGAIKIWEGKECNELEIKGFEYKKSDTAWISRSLQKDLLMIALESDENTKMKKELINHVLNIVNKITNKEVELDEIGIPRGMGKPFYAYKVDNPWLRGCRFANKYYGQNYGMGDKVKLLYLYPRVIGNGIPGTDTYCFTRGESVPKEIINLINTEYMIEKVVELKAKRILEVCGIKWKDINIPRNQRVISKYFKKGKYVGYKKRMNIKKSL